MDNFYKLNILWFVGLLFFPIGLQMIITNNPFLIFLSFFITIIIMILMIRYSIKIFKNRNNYDV